MYRVWDGLLRLGLAGVWLLAGALLFGQNVGIGTVNPQYRLHVAGDAYIRDSLRVDGDFRPGGVSGLPGQVLVSQGSGAPPQWRTFPTLSSWYLWHVDFWGAGANDPGTQGWTGANTTNCGGQWLLGGYGECGNGCVLSKTFTGLPPHSAVLVEIDWWSLDSWDHESGSDGIDHVVLSLDGVQVAKALPTAPYGGSWGNDNRLTDASLCGVSQWIDQGPQTIRGVLSHSSDTLTVSFHCNVSQGSTNESCGVVMVRVWLRP